MDHLLDVVVIVCCVLPGSLTRKGVVHDSASLRGPGHHIGLMYFGLSVLRLQVQVCQGVIVSSCIVIRPTLPSELAFILDGTPSNSLMADLQTSA